MPFCSVKCCSNNSKTSSLQKNGITFHRFPKSPSLNETWRDATHRGKDWLPKQHNTICSVHFANDCFKMPNEQRQLLETAVPTLNLTHKSEDNSLPSASGETLTSLHEALQKSSQNPPPEKRVKSDTTAKKSSAKSATKKNEKQKKKIPAVKHILNILTDKRLIEYEVADFLQYIEFDSSELMENEPNASDSDHDDLFSDELKLFAITLHFNSPKAYDYVRNTYKTCLPPENRLFEWYLTEDGCPGFTKEAVKAISDKAYESPEQIFATVIADKIQIERDCSVNYGFAEEFEADNDMARSALFFLLVPLNGTWKIPIGYFLASFSAEEIASLLKQAVNLAEDAGINVKAVTLRRYSSSGFGEALGCSTDVNNMKATFKNPSSGDDVAVFLDAKLMMVLLQFSWMSHKKFTDQKGNVASWQDLENVQSLLGKKHLKKWKEKACSSLVLDKNLADYLTLCHEKNLSEFKNVKGTIDLLRTLNDLVDILDSHRRGVDFKKAVSNENCDQVLHKLKETEDMLRTLSGIKDGVHVKAINSKHNMGFLGLCLITVAAQGFIKDLMENPETVVPMHRTNPVNLQHFLGVIMNEKRGTGFPYAYDVKETYKKLLKDIPIRNVKNSLPYSSIVHCPSAADRIKITSNNIEDLYNEFGKAKKSKKFTEIEEGLRQAIDDEKTSDFMSNYVAKKLIQELKCETCIEALVGQPLDKKTPTDTKKVIPSATVKEICIRCEKYIKTAVNECGAKHLCERYDSDFFVRKVLESFIGYDLFPDLNEHQFEVEITNHVIDLTICVVKKHVDARLWFICKSSS